MGRAQPKPQPGLPEVLASLQAGRHLLPSGGVVTLRTFKQQFNGRDFPVVSILRQHFPDIERAMRHASMTRLLAGGMTITRRP